MMSRRPQQPSGMSVSLAGGAPRRAPCGSLRRMATQWGVPNRCKVQAIRDPLGACGGWHGREKAVERSQPAHPQTAHHHSSCRRHPQACGADRHQAPASKPDPRPEVDVGHGGDGRQLRRGRANLILHLRAAAASIAARLIRRQAGFRSGGSQHQVTKPSLLLPFPALPCRIDWGLTRWRRSWRTGRSSIAHREARRPDSSGSRG
jgi:hypothetical protein